MNYDTSPVTPFSHDGKLVKVAQTVTELHLDSAHVKFTEAVSSIRTKTLWVYPSGDQVFMNIYIY